MSTKSVEFRSLPTPEQVRVHGEGGLWEGEGGTWYKLWDMPRNGSWWDSSCVGGNGFCAHGGPWTAMTGNPEKTKFRPLNPDGTPRDWAEIDAIVAGVPAVPAAEPDYRAPTDAELRAHVANGGMWEQYSPGHRYLLTGLRANNTLWGWGSDSWRHLEDGWLLDDAQHRQLRPVDKQGKPVPWPKVTQSTAEDWRPLPDTETLKRHRYWRSRPDEDGDVYYIHTTQTGKYDITEYVDELPTLSEWSEIDTDRDSEDMIIGPDRRWHPCNAQGNLLPWSAIAVPVAQASASTVIPPPEQRIEAAVPAATPAPEFRKLTREIVEANPGQLWVRNTSTDRDYGRIWKLAYREGTLESDYVSKNLPWYRLIPMVDVNIDQSWRPLHPSSTPDNRQPMPWSELKAAVSVPQAERMSLSSPTSLPKDGDPITVASAIAIAREGARQAMQEASQAQKPAASFKAWSPDGPSNITSITYSDELDQPEVRSSAGLIIGLTRGVYKAQAHLSGDIGRLPLIFDIVVRHAATNACPARTDILVGCRRTGFDSGKTDLCVDYILHDGLPPLASIDALGLRSKTLDIAAEHWYALSRQPNETDEQLRQRCRDAWKAKENPMPNVTSLGTPIPDFTKLSREDRARYRAALDAADPPTFRDAVRSGIEHAPVELALDKLHTFVSRLADLWTEGNEEERATVRRFLRDLLSSDYGKAAIGLGVGFAIPHAAPLAAKLLPDDKDAGPLLRRIGFILAERGTATGAKRLGLDIWDAAGPMLDELRNMLRDLVKGMKQAETVAGFLPPASPKLDLAADVFEAETLSAQKR